MSKKVGGGKYTLTEILGSGTFGRVYRADPYAIKEQVLVDRDPYLMKALRRQIDILKRLNHPNIVKTHDIFEESGFLYIVMDFCQMDLQKCLSSYVGNEKKAWDALRQIARGFKVLHREGILHRDLKPANILVKNGELKLADFGLAKLTEDAGQQMEHTILGTHLYKSPQLIRHLAYSAKCDVWSLGIIFYELLFGVYPWPSCKNNYKNDDEFLKAVRERLKLPREISAQSITVLQNMLAFEEQDRWSWEQVFEFVLPGEGAKMPMRQFNTADLLKLLEIELAMMGCDSRTIGNILNVNRKNPLKDQELQKLNHVIETFSREYHKLVRDMLHL